MARLELLLLLLAAAQGEEEGQGEEKENRPKPFGTGIGPVFIGGRDTDSEVGKDGSYTPSKLVIEVYACN